LESIKVLTMHKDSLGLHFSHRWLTHFGCVSGFSWLCHTIFGWGFILGHGAYQWSSSFRRCLGYFGHFVLMCNSLIFLYHTNNISFFFLPISFSRFRQENYVGMWGHYGCRIVGVFLRPLNEVSGSTNNIL